MKKKKIVGANMKVLYNIEKIRELVDDLFWEYDRMSSCGQKTLDEIADFMGCESGNEVEITSENNTWLSKRIMYTNNRVNN